MFSAICSYEMTLMYTRAWHDVRPTAELILVIYMLGARCPMVMNMWYETSRVISMIQSASEE